jgi:tetratricopeptide (TPR) repeat protein
MSRRPHCKTKTAGGGIARDFWSPRPVWSVLRYVCLMFVFLSASLFTLACAGQDTNTPATLTGRPDETNAQETLRAYLQLQEQLHETQLAIEQNRKESREAYAQNAEVLADRLKAIELALSAQRSRELDAMQSSNRLMLTVAGALVAVGFIAMLLMAYFQWRTVHGLAEISAAMPAVRAMGTGPGMGALGSGDASMVMVGPATQSSLRLLGAMERLEKRIGGLEQGSPAAFAGGAEGERTQIAENGPPDSSPNGNSEKTMPTSEESVESRVRLLLGKGQSMLNLDNPEEALACFDEALSLEPANTDGLVRKGTALERLQRLDEAIECYNRAIEADCSMTIAYLHKGGLYNRLERFNEALECYEQALRTQEKRHA